MLLVLGTFQKRGPHRDPLFSTYAGEGFLPPPKVGFFFRILGMITGEYLAGTQVILLYDFLKMKYSEERVFTFFLRIHKS